MPWVLVVALMLLCGALVGALQGFFVAYEGIPAFIVTLGGVERDPRFRPADDRRLFDPHRAEPGLRRPRPGLGARHALAGPHGRRDPRASASCCSTRRSFGRYVTGIGANAEAVRRAGVDTRRVTLLVYVLSGATAALAGIIVAARLGSGSSNAGQGFELDVIAAVVLGGTSLFGGRGTMAGTILGALTVAVIGNGLILSHLSPFLTPIVTGSIILLAIWMNVRIFRGGGRKR